MTPETVERSWWSEPLIWASCDCEMKKVLDEALSLLAGHPKILGRIEADQDAVGKAKKKVRQADQRWQVAQTLPLGLCVGEPVAADELTLGQGRPRMKPELVYVFLVLRGYLGSIGDHEARDRLLDSTTVQLYLLRRGEGLDDFSQVLLDSTVVKANSAWPTDARILLGLLERAFVGSQKLEYFGLSTIPVWWVPRWLKKLRQLLFKINNATGKPGSKSKRKKQYRQFFNHAAKIIDHLIPHCVEREPLQEAADQPPSRRALLVKLWQRLVQDVCDACAVFHYAEERIFEDQVRPAAEKLLSLADGEAAYIKKGGREAVIGYKPQLARSAQGFVPALLVPEGNAADSTQLVPLVQQIQERTGVTPHDVGTDDGYTSQQGRDALLATGVEQISFSGSKGKKLLSEEEWNDPAYVEARRQRSAIESLISVLKHVFSFGYLRRRGRQEVYAELLEKVIAYHFSRMLLVRQQKAAA